MDRQGTVTGRPLVITQAGAAQPVIGSLRRVCYELLARDKSIEDEEFMQADESWNPNYCRTIV